MLGPASDRGLHQRSLHDQEDPRPPRPQPARDRAAATRHPLRPRRRRGTRARRHGGRGASRAVAGLREGLTAGGRSVCRCSLGRACRSSIRIRLRIQQVTARPSRTAGVAGFCIRDPIPSRCAAMFRLSILFTTILVSALRAVLRSRSDLVLENIALRQQVEALKRRRRRPQLDDADRAFWLAMRSAWRGWAARLILVQPDTVVRWHREGSYTSTPRSTRALPGSSSSCERHSPTTRRQGT